VSFLEATNFKSRTLRTVLLTMCKILALQRCYTSLKIGDRQTDRRVNEFMDRWTERNQINKSTFYLPHMEYKGSIGLVSRKMKNIFADIHIFGLFE
jgi:hypothetical protein